MEIDRTYNPWQDNVQLFRSRSPSSPKYLSSYKIFSVRALHSIALANGLLVPHMKKQVFYWKGSF